MQYYSENWYDATEKFRKLALSRGNLQWCTYPGHKYDIPYVSIGVGNEKLVINSGIHGIEGYFGSAAQLMFLDKIVPNLSPDVFRKYTIVLIHVINGWGMQNRMREVRAPYDAGLVDLNRNFGVDFAHPEKLPQNKKYDIAHPLLLSEPDKVAKVRRLHEFRNKHMKDGVWAAISNGQYKHPYGLFYGGAMPMIENQMTLSIYDEIMAGATSLTSVGLHTGLGRFNRRRGTTTAMLLVSHPEQHENTQFFTRMMPPEIRVVHDNNAANGPVLQGDLVDCLEARYRICNIPVRTADFEIGTGEFPVMSPIYKRMDMGDARYDLLNYGEINPETWANLTESWYPSDTGWRAAALRHADKLFRALVR